MTSDTKSTDTSATDDDVITPDNIDEQLGALDPNAPKVNVVRKSATTVDDDDDAEEDPANPDESVVTTSESSPDSSTDDSKITIDESEYTREELEQIFALGKSVSDYKKEHAGFDPLLIEREYRHATHQLSQYEKKFGRLDGQTPAANAAPTPTPEEDLSDIDPKDLERLDKILRVKGYVKKGDLAEQERRSHVQTYESVKQQQVNAFVAAHPEYHPQNDPGDKNWGALLEEFGLYKLPEDPSKITAILERAHEKLAPKGKTLDPKKAAQILAQNRVNSATSAAAAGGNAGGGSTQVPKKSGKGLPPEAAHLKGFSDDELKEIFGQ